MQINGLGSSHGLRLQATSCPNRKLQSNSFLRPYPIPSLDSQITVETEEEREREKERKLLIKKYKYTYERVTINELHCFQKAMLSPSFLSTASERRERAERRIGKSWRSMFVSRSIVNVIVAVARQRNKNDASRRNDARSYGARPVGKMDSPHRTDPDSLLRGFSSREACAHRFQLIIPRSLPFTGRKSRSIPTISRDANKVGGGGRRRTGNRRGLISLPFDNARSIPREEGKPSERFHRARPGACRGTRDI